MSRQINKERTRHRLLQAILKTIQRYGHGTLTTGRVAELAGVAQPTFYVHFRSMDQALEQVADWVAEDSAELEKILVDIHKQVRYIAPNAVTATKEVLAATQSLSQKELVDFSAEKFAGCLVSEEGQEGFSAFIEKRQPNWETNH